MSAQGALRRIVKPFLRVLGVNSFGFILSLATAVLLADRVGAGIATDAFFLTRRLTTGVTKAIRQIVIVVYIPPIVRAMRSPTGNEARAEWRRHVFRILGTAVAASLAAAIVAPPIIGLFAPGFGEEQAALSVSLLRILVFTVPVGLIVAGISSVLFASKIFVLPSLAAILPRLFAVIVLLTAIPPLGVFELAWAVLAGAVLSIFVLLPPFLRARRVVDSDRVRDEGGPTDDPVEKTGVRGRTAPSVLMGLYRHGSGWVDLAIASTLIVGGVSVLEYSQRLVYIVPSLLMASVFAVVYTEFSHLGADRGYGDLPRAVARTVRIGLFLLIPFAAFVWVSADLIVDVIFAHGRFEAQIAKLTAAVTRYYSASYVLTFVMNTVTVGMFADMTAPHMRFAGSLAVLGLASRLAMAAILASVLGVVGIPLAAIATGALLALLALALASRHWTGFIRLSDLGAACKILLSSLFAWVAMEGLLVVVPVDPSTASQIVALLAIGVVGAAAFLTVAVVFKTEELAAVWRIARRRRR